MKLNDYKLIAFKILIEGTRLVALGAGAVVLKTLVTGGIDEVKGLSVKDLLA